MTCVCVGDDAAAALEIVRKARVISTLIDRSHLGVSVRRCGACGRTFLGVFAETVDWVNGDDPQSLVFVELDAVETQQILAATRVDEDFLLKLGISRRTLFSHWPSGGDRVSQWVTRPFWIPAHD